MRLLVFLCVFLTPFVLRAQELTVFAAASLTDSMKDISTLWAQAGHKALRLSFASSSSLARQIEQGAPANIFASADQKWMDYLAERQLIAADTRRNMLSNELVLIVEARQPRHVTLSKGFDLAGLLGANGRLATGDPKHVPVGIYAEQALKSLGIWASIAPRLAGTEDVRAALLLVERGEAPAGIVYATDAGVSKGVMVAGVFPPDNYEKIVYPFAVTRAGDTAQARAFMAFLATAPARDIFVRRGFRVE